MEVHEKDVIAREELGEILDRLEQLHRELGNMAEAERAQQRRGTLAAAGAVGR